MNPQLASEQTLKSPNFPTWCPGCGDYGIWASIKKAVSNLHIPEEELVFCFDIGCSGNMADFLRSYSIHALHGRSLPVAEGVKLANHGLKVIVIGGDGGIYGEGMGHFIAACRGNHDITLLVHNNQTYGLTTGQASPTTESGRETKSTPGGLVETPVNPISLAISSGASWVGRGYAGDISYTAGLLEQAIMHPGFSVLDVFQPCVTFNKVNTHQWYQQRVVKLETVPDYDPANPVVAWAASQQAEQLPIGIFYKTNTPPYHQHSPALQRKPLYDQFPSVINLEAVLQTYR